MTYSESVYVTIIRFFSIELKMMIYEIAITSFEGAKRYIISRSSK